MTINPETLPGYRNIYGTQEVRQAIANAEAAQQLGVNDTGNNLDPSALTETNNQLIAVRDRLMPPGTEANYLGDSSGELIKNTPGTIHAIIISNSSPEMRWVQIFNTSVNPTPISTPFRSFPIPPDNSLLVLGADIFGGGGLLLDAGIAWGFSSTRLSYTPAAAIDCIATVRYS